MSHTVAISTKFKCMKTLEKVAKAKGLQVDIASEGRTITRKLYSGEEKGVAAFQLAGWKYPVLVQEDGSCKADNYNGAWGKQTELDQFSQSYSQQLVDDQMLELGFRQDSLTMDNGTLELVYVNG